MPLPVLADALRAQVEFSGAAGQKDWSTHFDYTCTSGDFDLAAFATAFRTEFEAAFAALDVTEKSMWYTSCDILGYKFTAFTDPPAVVELSPTTPGFGTNNLAAPPQVAAVCTLRTAFAGASFRGRQYWGGLAQTAISSSTGKLVSSAVTAIQDLVTPMMGIVDGGAAAYALGVLSTVSGGAPRTPPIITVVSSLSVNTTVDTQRRRIA